VNIATSLEPTVKHSFDWQDDKVNLEIFVQRMSSESLADLAALSTAAQESDLANVAEQMDRACRLLARLLKSWDLNWNGEPWPPTFENLRSLPVLPPPGSPDDEKTFFMALLEAVMGLWQGNPTSAENSQGSSAPQAKA
jgi:hypothetical protein